MTWPVAWTDLTFGSTSSAYGKTIYAAGQTFDLEADDVFEIRAFTQGTNADDTGVGVGDGTNSVLILSQADGNVVLYRLLGASFTALDAYGIQSTHDYTGPAMLDLRMVMESTSSIPLSGRFNFRAVRFTGTSTASSIDLIKTVTPYIITTDISKCHAQARIIRL